MTPETLDEMAQVARTAWMGDRHYDTWSKATESNREHWRDAIRAVLDAGAPVPQPTPDGGFKPGDRVSVEGVVTKIGYAGVPELVTVRIDGTSETITFTQDAPTFIERPAPPEPDWRPGNLAVDDDGVQYVYTPGDGDVPARRPWFKTTGTIGWRRRDEIPGRLHKLTVTREDEAQ